MIEKYNFGSFLIDGKEYNDNVVLIGNKVEKARYLPNHELSLNDIYDLVEYNPDYLIIGTGASGVMPVPEEISNFVKKKGIKLIIKRTGEACKKFNSLIKEGKKVAAFLHNTC